MLSYIFSLVFFFLIMYWSKIPDLYAVMYLL